MSVPAPGSETRWRCALFGNPTRFDVVGGTRVREFVHVAGNAVVEERAVLADTVERVTCRWCHADDRVQIVPRPDAAPAEEDAPPP